MANQEPGMAEAWRGLAAQQAEDFETARDEYNAAGAQFGEGDDPYSLVPREWYHALWGMTFVLEACAEEVDDIDENFRIADRALKEVTTLLTQTINALHKANEPLNIAHLTEAIRRRGIVQQMRAREFTARVALDPEDEVRSRPNRQRLLWAAELYKASRRDLIGRTILDPYEATRTLLWEARSAALINDRDYVTWCIDQARNMLVAALTARHPKAAQIEELYTIGVAASANAEAARESVRFDP